MKKILVLTIAVTLLAASFSFAGVRNTKHDLSSDSTSGGVKSDNYSEVCVFCHTPHGATTGRLAPLWNRSSGSRTFGVGDLYNSASLDAVSKPSAVEAAINLSDAALCLSCHDGSGLAGGLNNPSNTATVPGAQPSGGALLTVGANANLNPDLSNDHPIGMNYVTVQSNDTAGFLVMTDATVPGFITNAATDTIPFYDYAGTNVMWCSTCHDVHDDTTSPFLVTSNVGSDLCTSCHIK